MSAAFTIRPAAAADVAAVEAALREADLSVAGLRDQFGEGYAIAEAEGQFIGVEGIELHGTDGLLRSAAVVPAWRGRGVGDALTRDRIAWARGRGIRTIFLLTNTAGDFFPRFGFLRIARDAAPDAIRRSVQFSETCCASALVMALPLQGNTIDE